MRNPPERYAVAWLLSAAILLSPAAAEEDGKPDQPNAKFHVNLTDGSSIVCKPLIATLPIKTSYAELAIPFHRLRRIELSKEDKKAKVKFMNGDIIQGTCPLKSLEIETVLGKITISMEHVTEISSAMKEEPPAPVYHDSPEKKNACINNLRMIDSAKEQFALANRLGDGAVVQGPPIGAYLKGGWQAMKCPAGGQYKINPIGRDPECTVPGHSLQIMHHRR